MKQKEQNLRDNIAQLKTELRLVKQSSNEKDDTVRALEEIIKQKDILLSKKIASIENSLTCKTKNKKSPPPVTDPNETPKQQTEEEQQNRCEHNQNHTHDNGDNSKTMARERQRYLSAQCSTSRQNERENLPEIKSTTMELTRPSNGAADTPVTENNKPEQHHTLSTSGSTKPNKTTNQMKTTKETINAQDSEATTIPSRITYRSNKTTPKTSYDDSIGDWPSNSFTLDDYDDGFEGAKPRRKVKWLVLSRINSRLSWPDLQNKIIKYAQRKNVELTFVRHLKSGDVRNSYSLKWYTLRINVNTNDCDSALRKDFWPENIICREWISDHEESSHASIWE
ncbi:unnamed protein product [Owenia fusiformis]|uniref:Uncharacterized protein n=1 Tax=Owenia fusiformis TaxID=6347 RepID=A0A8S4PIH4_OWEFU|nr:unnamed protein product [Owenia fusiformis]